MQRCSATDRVPGTVAGCGRVGPARPSDTTTERKHRRITGVGRRPVFSHCSMPTHKAAHPTVYTVYSVHPLPETDLQDLQVYTSHRHGAR